MNYFAKMNERNARHLPSCDFSNILQYHQIQFHGGLFCMKTNNVTELGGMVEFVH